MLTNYQTEVPKSPGEHFTVGELLTVALEAAPPSGLGLAEMRRRDKPLRVIEATELDAEFAFSAEQLVFVRDVFEAHKWGKHFRDIITIADQLTAAAETTKKKD